MSKSPPASPKNDKPPDSPNSASQPASPTSGSSPGNAKTAETLLVNVERVGEGPALVTVFIDRDNTEAKSYRGGFADIRTGRHYLNAVAQTRENWPPQPKKTYPSMISRETQLSEMRSHIQQTVKESFTHMEKKDYFVSLEKNGLVIDTRFDYYRIPGPYEDSDAWMRKRITAAIIIQKYTRRKIAYRTAKRMRQYAKEKKQFWSEQEVIKKNMAAEKLRWEIQRRIQPQSGADFDILYQELEHWRLQEHRKLVSKGDAKIAEVKELLNKELKLLQAIDKLKVRASKLNYKDRISKHLSMMANPKIWEMTNGQIMHVKTPATNRASDLGALYQALVKKMDSIEVRMGVLGYVKWTVQVFDSPLTRQILMLIEREADLMYRGRSSKSLSGLRQRISNMFLQFIETPEYNPEAEMFQYVPADFDRGSKHFQSMRDAPYEFP